MNLTRRGKRILISGIALAFILIVVFFVYWVGLSSARNFPEFEGSFDNKNEIAVVSMSPQGMSGVSQNEPLVIQWNRPVTVKAADAVTITPAAKGQWQAIGNKLVFQPQRWQSGTYYKVSIEKGTEIPGSGNAIQEDVSFAFETQDSTLRIPSTNALYLESRQFFFQEDEELAIPLSYYDSTAASAVPEVSARLWSCPDSESFIETFLPLFMLPRWASLSANKFMAETVALHRMGHPQCRLEDGVLYLENPGAGMYLLRINVGGISRDVAVTVGGLDSYAYYDGQNLLYYCVSPSDATLLWGDQTAVLDDQGCALLQWEENESSAQVLRVQITADEEQIIFLPTAEDAAMPYYGEIAASKQQINIGDDLHVFGYVRKTLPMDGIDAVGDVTISLENQNGAVETVDVALDDQGFFSATWENLALPKGQWKAVAHMGQKEIASYGFTVSDEEGDEPCLLVKSDADSYEFGEEIIITVRALDEQGSPIEGLSVTASGDVGRRVTDQNGEAEFFFRAVDSGLLPILDQRFVFSAALDQGTVLKAEYRYSLSNGNSGDTAPKGPSETIDEVLHTGEAVVYAAFHDGALVISDEEPEDYDFIMVGQHGEMTVLPPKDAASALDLPASLTATAGSSLSFSPDDDVHAYVAMLYEGNSSGSARRHGILCDSLEDALTMDVKAVDMIANGGDAFSLTVPAVSGHYFLRVYEILSNQSGIYWDIPVTVSGGVRLWSDGVKNYVVGRDVTLSFRAQGSADHYRLILNDGTVKDGAVSDDFAIRLGKLEEGNYRGELILENDGRTVLRRGVSFSVGRDEPLLAVTEDAGDRDIWQAYQVPDAIKPYVKKLFSLNLPHGDQLLQVMARNDFYSALGENAGSLVVYCNGDILDYQNNDGSFGRLAGSQGDMLLSALVAANENVQYNRNALLAYAKARIASDSDTEILALRYWITTMLGEPPLDEMKALLQYDDLSDLAVLYLAEGFLAVGETSLARSIYGTLGYEMNHDNDLSYFPDSDPQRAITKTLFMLDLALSLGEGGIESYVNYLLSVDMTTQTNRYLMSQCLLRLIQPAEIRVSDKGNLFLVAESPGDGEIFPSFFLMDGKNVARCKVGDTVTLDVQWSTSYKTNNLYLVYLEPNDSIKLYSEDQMFQGHGYATVITAESGAQISFKAISPTDGVLGTVCVYDLTAGTLLGKVESKGLVVEE